MNAKICWTSIFLQLDSFSSEKTSIAFTIETGNSRRDTCNMAEKLIKYCLREVHMSADCMETKYTIRV